MTRISHGRRASAASTRRCATPRPRLGIAEFRAESLPAERERANRLAAERAAAVDTGSVEIEDRSIAGPDGRPLGLRLYRGPEPRRRRRWWCTPTVVAS